MSPEYLELEDLLTASESFLGHEPEVRDYGLLESALARPRATVFGRDVYPTLDDTAAALVFSLVPNRALVDGNKRLGWLGVVTFYELNGRTVRIVDDAPVETIMAIGRGELVDVPVLAAILRTWTTPWRCRHAAARTRRDARGGGHRQQRTSGRRRGTRWLAPHRRS